MYKLSNYFSALTPWESLASSTNHLIGQTVSPYMSFMKFIKKRTNPILPALKVDPV